MIGRAAIGYPWIFNEIKHYIKTGETLPPPTIQQRIEVIKQHLYKSIEWKGELLGILEMRRHYTNYLKGFPYMKEFRNKLVTLKSVEEIEEVLHQIERRYDGFVATKGAGTVTHNQIEACESMINVQYWKVEMA
jgi:tRNA-dihydrouridine synthase